MNILNNLNLPTVHWQEILRLVIYTAIGSLATPTVQSSISALSGIPMPILVAVISAAVAYLHKVVTVPTPPPPPAA